MSVILSTQSMYHHSETRFYCKLQFLSNVSESLVCKWWVYWHVEKLKNISIGLVSYVHNITVTGGLEIFFPTFKAVSQTLQPNISWGKLNFELYARLSVKLSWPTHVSSTSVLHLLRPLQVVAVDPIVPSLKQSCNKASHLQRAVHST